MRSFGALVFGRIGDVVGRKTTALVRMAIMGLSTFLVGPPNYPSIVARAVTALVGPMFLPETFRRVLHGRR